jgi:type I restriction enzyme M protein
MALKKSDLYSSLWSSCDELRGGMDASQPKDYVLVLLFIKYVSDKYAGVPYAPITIPAGASFKDMVALKGKSDIGDRINKKIIGPLANANKLSDMPDFNDPGKLGSGKEMVERLTNLIAIFENRSLDFSKNRADCDDILGDAYEYLTRHFATESGKSKGQFYTPAEVSRIIAQIRCSLRSHAGSERFGPELWKAGTDNKQFAELTSCRSGGNDSPKLRTASACSGGTYFDKSRIVSWSIPSAIKREIA